MQARVFEKKQESWEKSYSRRVKELRQALKDKETLRAFESRLTYLENSGKAKTRASKEAHELLLLNSALGGLVISDYLDKEKGKRLFAAYRQWMSTKKYSDYTTAVRLGDLKIFLAWYCKENDLPEPKYLKDINSTPPQSLRVTEENVLTLDECKQIWQTPTHPRNQALIVIAFESAMRLQELLDLRVGDIKQCTENGKDFFEASFAVQKQKRRGKRVTQALIWAAPYLFAWLKVHPSPTNKDSWLFCNVHAAHKDLIGAQMGKQTAHKMLVGVAKKAGITKAVSFHRLRHAGITFELLHGGLNEPQVKAKHGYSDKSNILNRYTHLSSRNVSDREKMLKGIGSGVENGIKLPEHIVCGRCGLINAEESQICVRCGFELNADMRLIRMKKSGFQAAESILGLADQKTFDALMMAFLKKNKIDMAKLKREF